MYFWNVKNPSLDPRIIQIENETLFSIHGHFAMPTCMVILQCQHVKKNKGSHKISNENDFQGLKNIFSVGWHVGKYENIIY